MASNLRPQEEQTEAPQWLIDNISEASKNARTIFILYLGFWAYCALTIVGTSDRQIILDEGVNLPIIGLDVPFSIFFATAPVLLVFIFLYLQLYLQRLKGLRKDLRENYAPTGKRRLYPWMVNIAEDPEPGMIGKLQQAAVQVMLWWSLPLVLVLFAIWFLKKHLPVWSYVMGVAPLIGVALVLYFWHQYEAPRRFWRSWSRVLMVVVAIVLGGYFLFSLIPRSLDGRGVTVDLSHQVLITEQEAEYDVPWLGLQGVRLEGADLTGAVLKNADLRSAHLQGADLREAQLQGASLRRAQLQGASLRRAQLQRVDLLRARLRRADLQMARLDSASLWEANLQEAELQMAYLRGAMIRSGYLQGANLAGARLQGADLQMARLDSVSFVEANLQEAELQMVLLRGGTLLKTDLQGANFHGAQLQGTSLRGARLDGAVLWRTGLQETDLRWTQFDGAIFWEARLRGSLLGDRPQPSAGRTWRVSISNLCRAQTLFEAELDSLLTEELIRQCPEILERPQSLETDYAVMNRYFNASN